MAQLSAHCFFQLSFNYPSNTVFVTYVCPTCVFEQSRSKVIRDTGVQQDSPIGSILILKHIRTLQYGFKTYPASLLVRSALLPWAEHWRSDQGTSFTARRKAHRDHSQEPFLYTPSIDAELQMRLWLGDGRWGWGSADMGHANGTQITLRIKGLDKKSSASTA